jgi:hypothetical protein
MKEGCSFLKKRTKKLLPIQLRAVPTVSDRRKRAPTPPPADPVVELVQLTFTVHALAEKW